MDNLFLAKSKPRQTIEEHTLQVVNSFLSLVEIYPYAVSQVEKEAIETACFIHDPGKMGSRFQNKLYKVLKLNLRLDDGLGDLYDDAGIDEVPHGILSALFLDYQKCVAAWGEPVARAVLLAICYHHHRHQLQDIIDYQTNLLIQIAKHDLAIWSPHYSIKSDFYKEPPDIKNLDKLDIEWLREEESEWANWALFAKVKGLLNRADYAASGGLNALEIAPEVDGQNIAQIISDRLPSLRPVQQYMAGHQEENLIVIASTGIGKTEAALLWNGGRKLFYTLPLRVSINEIYKRIRFKYEYSKAELLHSDALAYYLQEVDKERNELDVFVRYNQARLFATPLTVCTVDQLFKFVFKCNGYEAMYATLSYSNVVIDELQMYPPDIIACILYGLKLITKAGGKFAIITATFPPILRDFFRQLDIPYVMPDEPFYSELKFRHWISLRQGDFNLDEILKHGKTKKVLIIVNTAKRARELYAKLRNRKDIPVKLLHKDYLLMHRRILETEIMDFSKLVGANGIWICTQLVEASLDIDFDILFTEMSIADSLLQRMGRCFRSREYLGLEPNIFIHNTGNGIGSVYDRDLHKYSWQALQEYDGKIFEESLKQEYIKKVYDPVVNKDILDTEYCKGISSRLNMLRHMPPLEILTKEVEEKFRNIKSITLIPDIIYCQLENDGTIENWQRNLADHTLDKIKRAKLLNEIYNYSVNTSWYPKLRDFIDRKEAIFDGSGIYRSQLRYDFDSEKNQGFGLINDEIEPNNL